MDASLPLAAEPRKLAPHPDCTRRASLRPLLIGVLIRPVLLAAVLLPVLIAWGLVGTYFGLPDLFWHPGIGIQLLSGVGAALLFGHLSFISYLLREDEKWLEGLPSDAAPGTWRWRVSAVVDRVMTWLVPGPRGIDPESPALAWRKLRWYLSVTWLPLLVLGLLLPAFIYPSTDWPATGDERDYWDRSARIGLPYLSEGSCAVLPLTDRCCLVVGITCRWRAVAGAVLALVLCSLLLRAYHRLYPWASRRWGGSLLALAGRLPRQLWLHLGIVLCFAVLVAVFRDSPLVLSPLVGTWALAHGGAVGLSRIAALGPADRWKHVLAGAVLGTTFAAYELLFILYAAAPIPGAARFLSPALALCLLLALTVAVYGFLRFHFRPWYAYLIVGLIVLGGLINSVLPERLGFAKIGLPGLDHSADRVELQDSDFEAVRDDGALPADSRHEKLRVLCGKLEQRLRAQRAAHGLPPLPSQTEALATSEAIQKRHEVLRKALADLEDQRLTNWSKLAGKGQPPKMIVVAVSGGANRSALWTAVVLAELEREFRTLPGSPELGHNVRVITGASGGMVGASYYAATLKREGGHGDLADAGALERFLLPTAGDHLTPIAQRALFVDLPMAWLPVENTYDRGRALEDSWARHQDGALKQSFRALAQGEAEGWRPSLILSPMLVEDGRLLLVSNLYLPFLTENRGSFLTPDEPPTGVAPARARRTRPRAKGLEPDGPGQYRYSLSALEFFNLFPHRDDFELGTAVRMSATFPYASPAAELPTTPRRRVVDAGYYDNYGVGVASSWIYHYRELLLAQTSGVVLIQIRDQASDERRLYGSSGESDSWLWRGVEWLTGPLVGAKSAMESVSSFRNDEQVQSLSDYFARQTDDPDWFTTVVFDCREEVAMNWYLSREEIDHLRRGFKPYRNEKGEEVEQASAKSLRRLRAWWTRP